MNIYPAILSESIDEVVLQLQTVQSLKGVEVVQMDILDGRFADNLTVTPMDLVGLSFEDLQLDFHLMVEEPTDFVHEILDYQKDLPVRGVIAHIERMSDQQEYIDLVIANKMKVGLSLDLFTSLEEIEKDVLDKLDIIQLMGIEAGFQGQAFQKSVFEKIEQLVAIKRSSSLDFELVIDGGVKEDVLNNFSNSGVNSVAIGSWLWKNENPQSVVDKILSL
ncbi:MAG: Ribulose-phosphate 3-epimerase [Microgenomates bacterium 39_7]|nr:MAG: Ribulose-phosphate 3-epimerase [Microgenomates bacterium 39_7]